MSTLQKISNHVPGEPWENQRAPIQLRMHQVSRKLMEFGSSVGAAVFDQGIISGTNLITTILIGRCCGAKSLGWYAIGFTFIVLAETIHRSLITAPYTVYANRWRGRRLARYAGSVLTHHIFISVLAILSFGGASMMLSFVGKASTLASLLAVLSVTIPCLLLRTMVRRIAYAHLRASVALLADTTVMILQIGALAALALTGNLTVATAFAAMALACAVSGGLWLGWALPKRIVRKRHALASWKRNWAMGRWILATEMTASLRSCIIPWQLALMLGDAATGLFAACMTVISLSNPLVTGMGNIMSPRIARAMGQKSLATVRHEVIRLTWILALSVAAFCLFVGFGGSHILALIYGDEFATQGTTLTVLALAIFFSAIGHPPGFGLLAMERSKVHFILRLIGLGVTATATLVLLPVHHVLGAAEALLLGSLIVTTLTHWVFHRLSCDHQEPSETFHFVRNSP